MDGQIGLSFFPLIISGFNLVITIVTFRTPIQNTDPIKNYVNRTLNTCAILEYDNLEKKDCNTESEFIFSYVPKTY